MGAVCSVEQLPKPLPPTSKQAQKLSELVDKENQHFLQYKSSIPKKPLFGSSDLTKTAEKFTDNDHDSTQFYPGPISQPTFTSITHNVSTPSPTTRPEDETFNTSQTSNSENDEFATSGMNTPVENMESEYPEHSPQSPLLSKRSSSERDESIGMFPVGSEFTPENMLQEHQETIPSEMSILAENDSWWSSEDERHPREKFQETASEKEHIKAARSETNAAATSPAMERDQPVALL